jgi:phosphate transport system permease protein
MDKMSEVLDKDQPMATYSESVIGSRAALAKGAFDLRKRPRLSESLIQAFLFFCGTLSIFTTLGIVVVLFEESWRFFGSPEVSLVEFLTTTTWQPKILQFGIWPLLNATMMTTTFAMLVAVPIGIAVAIYLSEYAQERVRKIVKPTLEVLAGIPTVVYGYFALTWFTPQLRNIFGSDTVQVYNTLSAGLVMGILILPLVATMCEDALYAVPRSLREAAYGLGATKLETSLKIVLPAATSGIAAAIILGISRAIGETMIVAIAAGAGPNFTFNPFKGAETITGHIVRISGGDLSWESIDYNSLFALALVLFFMTLALNLVSQRIVRRFREVYE